MTNNSQVIRDNLIAKFEEILENKKSRLSLYNEDFLNELDAIYSEMKSDIFKTIEIEKYLYSILNDKNDIQEILNIINVLKAFNNNTTLTIPKETLEQIRNNRAVKNLLESIIRQTKNYKNFKESIENVEKIITYLSSLGKHDYLENLDLILEFIKKDYFFKQEEKYRINYDINTMILQYNFLVGQNNLDYNPTKEKIIEEYNKNRLTIEELTKILSEYDYDINLINNTVVNSIAKSGYIDNIRYILQWYRDTGMEDTIKDKLSKGYDTNKYFIMLYKSDKEIIERMIGASLDLEIPVTELFERTPSVFMHKSNTTRVYVLHGSSGNNDTATFGSHEDFVANKELFEKLGYDVTDIYNKCSSVLTYSHRIIKNNINSLKSYDIDMRANHNGIKLTGLRSTDILFTIDQFVELDELDYVKANTSRLSVSPDSIFFYKLYYAKKNGEEYKSTTHPGSYKSYITRYDNSDKVSIENKREDTNTIKPVIFGEPFDQKLKDMITISDCDINFNIFEEPIFKTLDEKCLTEDKMAYKIGNSRFSKLKVGRLLSVVDEFKDYVDENKLVLYCLTYNSIISQEDFDLVKSELSSLLNERSLS